MAEYIERSYIRDMAMFKMAYTMETETDAAVVLRMIDDAPAADAAPVRHGHWVGEGDDYDDGELVYDVWYCSECDYYGTDDPELLPKYCPNCGAKMDGGETNDGA